MSDFYFIPKTDYGEKTATEMKKAHREGRLSDHDYECEIASLAREGHVTMMKKPKENEQ